MKRRGTTVCFALIALVGCRRSSHEAGDAAATSASPAATVAETTCSGKHVDLRAALEDVRCRIDAGAAEPAPEGVTVRAAAPAPVTAGSTATLNVTFVDDGARPVVLFFFTAPSPGGSCGTPWDPFAGVGFDLGSIGHGTGTGGIGVLGSGSGGSRKGGRHAKTPPTATVTPSASAAAPTPDAAGASVPCGFDVQTTDARGATVGYVPPSPPGTGGILSLIGSDAGAAGRPLVRVELAPNGQATIAVGWKAVGYTPDTVGAKAGGFAIPPLPPGRYRVTIETTLAGALPKHRPSVDVEVVASH